ncbi:MAG: sigma 54-interacting transcriptional regulator [Myxococcota bacterium]
MSLFRDDERAIAEGLAALADTNPFGPERIDHERGALGSAFARYSDVWHVDVALDGLNPNTNALRDVAGSLADRARERLASGGAARASARDLVVYEALCRFALYMAYEDELMALVRAGERGERASGRVACWPRFERDHARLLRIEGVRLPAAVAASAGTLFAWGFQIRRAFHHVFRRIYGGSMPAARLRAAVWESIFTRDPARYRRALVDRMGDVPTLITGETGTGKELVARAIALSRFIAFDVERGTFAEDYATCFHAVNLAALSPGLIESELFGHRRGSFTGALEDRAGWLEACSERGSVFLDEIGELAPELQVKLLRVLEQRTFQRIGETRDRRFAGKILAATNRDLAAEIDDGRFREDLFYRLCADAVRTPTLREQLADAPDDLPNLLLVIARRVAGDDEAPALVDEVQRCVARDLGADYAWPGNVRELEQCVRSVLVRGTYRPERTRRRATGGLAGELARAIEDGALGADDLVRLYCTHVYARTRSYEETGRRLGLDRRTVKAKLDRERLARLEDGDA